MTSRKSTTTFPCRARVLCHTSNSGASGSLDRPPCLGQGFPCSHHQRRSMVRKQHASTYLRRRTNAARLTGTDGHRILGLDSEQLRTNNGYMVIRGRVHNGVVVPQGSGSLPEGADVSISFPALAEPIPAVEKRRIEVPLIRTGQPGTVHLTGASIAEILDAEDLAAGR
jgi:hypothetical protein